MSKPHRHWWCLLNPPRQGHFTAHEAAVRNAVQHFANRGIEFVDIYYGYGFAARLVLDIDCEGREQELMELFEQLRAGQVTKMSVLDEYPELSADERDRLVHGGEREA